MTKYDAVRVLAKAIREIVPAQQERSLSRLLRASCKGKTPAEIVDAVERAGFERIPRPVATRLMLADEEEMVDLQETAGSGTEWKAC